MGNRSVAKPHGTLLKVMAEVLTIPLLHL